MLIAEISIYYGVKCAFHIERIDFSLHFVDILAVCNINQRENLLL